MTLRIDRPYLITAVLLLAGAAWLVREALALRYYTSLGPGAGFFPFWLALLLAVLSVLLLVQSLTGRVVPGEEPPALPSTPGALRVAVVTLAIAGTALLLEPLGFRLTMLAFLLILLATLGRQKLWVSAVVATASAFAAHYLFAVWLGVPLPLGRLGI